MTTAEPKFKCHCHCQSVRQAASAVTNYYNTCLESVGVSITQFALLMNIQYRQPCSVKELSRRVRLEKSTLVRTLRPLQDMGLIEDISAHGSRERQLRLTPSGEKALEKGIPLWKGAQKTIEKLMDKHHIQAFFEDVEELAGR